MNHAYVTYMTTDSYLPGVMALNKSLKLFNRKNNKLIVMTTRTLSEKTVRVLESIDCGIRYVEEIKMPESEANTRDFNHYTKLRVFDMIEFKKIIFLDADLLICSDIESLFQAPHMSSVVAGGLIPENNWTDLNGGLLVIEPSRELFNEMHGCVGHLPSIDGTDQGFLQSFYKEWPARKELHLDHRYNVPLGYLETYCEDHHFSFSYKDNILETDIAVLHYWGPVKPWHIDVNLPVPAEMYKQEEALRLWWDFYTAARMDIDS